MRGDGARGIVGGMDERFARLPRYLEERAKWVRFDGPGARPEGGTSGLFGGVQRQIPTLLAHPEQGIFVGARAEKSAPLMIWMHGRQAHKELDPGRYLRWLRAGIGVCAIDMPGHGERADEAMQGPETSLEIIQHVADHEIDHLISSLRASAYADAFDFGRIGIGGMSLGGITTLVRLCREHDFACATVEACAGDFGPMQGRKGFRVEGDRDAGLSDLARRLEPASHLEAWRAIPLLALHSEKDMWVPVACIRNFVEQLREHHAAIGADPELVRLKTWEETGAEYEHIGFGKVSNEAKNVQTEFLGEWLGEQ